MELARRKIVARGIPLNAPVIAALSMTAASGQELKHTLAEKHTGQDGFRVDQKVAETFSHIYSLVISLQIDPGRVVPCNLLSSLVQKAGPYENAPVIAILDVAAPTTRIVVDSAALRLLDTITHRNHSVVREWLESHLGDELDPEARKRTSAALALECLAASERIVKQGQMLMLGQVYSGLMLQSLIRRPDLDLRANSDESSASQRRDADSARTARLLASIFSMTSEPRVVIATGGLGHYIDFSSDTRTFTIDPVVTKLTDAEFSALVGYGVMRSNLCTLNDLSLETPESLKILTDWHTRGTDGGNFASLQSALAKFKAAGFVIEPRELRAINAVCKKFPPGKRQLTPTEIIAEVNKLAKGLGYFTMTSFSAADALALDIGAGGDIFRSRQAREQGEAIESLRIIAERSALSPIHLMSIGTVLPVGTESVASNTITALCDGDVAGSNAELKDLIRAKNSFIAIGDFVGHSNLANLLAKMPRERRVAFLIDLCGGSGAELDSDQSARLKLIGYNGKDSKSSSGHSLSDYLKLGNLDAINFLRSGFGADALETIVKVLNPERFAKDAELSSVVSKLRKILVRRWGLALVPAIRDNSTVKAECLPQLQACFIEAEGYVAVMREGIHPQVSTAITALQRWLRVPQGAALLAIKGLGFEKVLKGDTSALSQQLGYLQADAELAKSVLPKFLKAVSLKRPPTTAVTLPIARALSAHVSSPDQAIQMTAFLLKNHASDSAVVTQSLAALPLPLVAEALSKLITDGRQLVSAIQTCAPELAVFVLGRIPDSHLSGLLSNLDTAEIQGIAHHIPAERRASIIAQSDSPQVVKAAVELRNRYEALLLEFGDVTDYQSGRRVPNYYAALGSPPLSTPEELKRAYNKLNFAYHQDRFQHEPPAAREAATRYHTKIVEAYKFLSDPAKRGPYDRATRATIGQARYSKLFPSESLFSEQS